MKLDLKKIEPLIDTALLEDAAFNDITTNAIIPADLKTEAEIISMAEGILVGIEVARMVFKKLDPEISFEALKEDGEKIHPHDIIARICGHARGILSGERTALNFLQHLSGIATTTARFVILTEGFHTRILDTRKTLPGMRHLQKYAVYMGGGTNHRLNLEDGILIKNNHLKLCSITEAVLTAREKISPEMKIEVEVETIEQLMEALEAEADIILLDNMDLSSIAKSLEIVKGRKPLEVSGGVTPDIIRPLAQMGIDFISIGALTHSAKALDIKLRIIKAK